MFLWDSPGAYSEINEDMLILFLRITQQVTEAKVAIKQQQHNNNNNNKAFKSQTSWGRLELKPTRSNQGSGT